VKATGRSLATCHSLAPVLGARSWVVACMPWEATMRVEIREQACYASARSCSDGAHVQTFFGAAIASGFARCEGCSE
jgi:hypothetical protein